LKSGVKTNSDDPCDPAIDHGRGRACAYPGRTPLILHAVLLTALIWQSVLGAIVTPPHPGQPDGLALRLHEDGGAVLVVLLVAAWAVQVVGAFMSDPLRLFPWFSRSRMRVLIDDASHLVAGSGGGTAVLCAFTGLGLLLASFMAASGVAWWLGSAAISSAALTFHRDAADLVWVYLVANTVVAVRCLSWSAM